MKYMYTILALLITAVLFADTITLKSGLTIKGDVIALDADTVIIQTKTGELKIPTAEIEEIIIEDEKKTEEVPQVQDERVLNDQAIPRSIKQVGCGCLGGVVAGSAALILAWTTEGFGGSGDATVTIISGAIILGVIVGFISGGS